MDAYFEAFRENETIIYCGRLINNSYSAHFQSDIEVCYVLDGCNDVMINGETRSLTKGAFAVANSYDFHSYSTHGVSDIYVLIVPSDYLDSYRTLLQGMTFAQPFVEHSNRSGELRQVIERLLSYHETRNSPVARGYLHVVLGLLIEESGLVKRTSESSAAVLMRNILIDLEENYFNDISIAYLAKKYGYNKNYLSRIFNERLGCSFNFYINMRRARHAADLIRTTNLSLEEIAFRSGFHNIKTYTSAFFTCYQVTPYKYRKQMLREMA